MVVRVQCYRAGLPVLVYPYWFIRTGLPVQGYPYISVGHSISRRNDDSRRNHEETVDR